jgi:hypothetical protein
MAIGAHFAARARERLSCQAPLKFFTQSKDGAISHASFAQATIEFRAA